MTISTLKRALLICVLGVVACGDDEAGQSGNAGADAAGDGGDGGSPSGAGRVFTGDYTIENDADVAFLLRFEEITGTLTIRSSELVSVDLPALENVSGNLRVSVNTQLESLTIANLNRVGGDLILSSNPALADVSGLASVTRVGGDVVVSLAGRITEVSWNNLGTVGGNLAIGTQQPGDAPVPLLTRLSFNALDDIGGTFQVSRTDALTEISLPNLEDAGGLFIASNGQLPRISLGQLESLSGTLRIADNPSLVGFDLNRLSSVGGDFRVINNPSLPNCSVRVLLGRLNTNGFGGEAEVTGNDEAAVCEGVCSPVGATDARGWICMADGSYTRPCSDEACLLENELCERDPASRRFNLCRRADSITNNCAAGDTFDSDRDDGGSVIYNLGYGAYPDRDLDCEALAPGTLAFEIAMDYRDGDENAFTESSEEALAAFEWIALPEDPESEEEEIESNASDLALVFSDDADGTTGSVALTICREVPPQELAVRIRDTAGARSNVACALLR